MIQFVSSVKNCILGRERSRLGEVFLQSLRKDVNSTELQGSLLRLWINTETVISTGNKSLGNMRTCLLYSTLSSAS